MRFTSKLTVLTLATAVVAMLAAAGCQTPEAQLERLAERLAAGKNGKEPVPDSVAAAAAKAAPTLAFPVAPSQPIIRRIITDGATVAELANGMTVIIKPTRTAPVVCVRAYVRAGGIYEGKWLGCGLSHLLEHLVAGEAIHDGDSSKKATKPTKDRTAEIGGQSNAYTTLDHTCYYIAAASSKTMACIDLIADWMSKAAITKTDFEREHGVVQRELEMGKDSPSRQMWYANSANAFPDHPASVPVIGFAPALAGVTHKDVVDYHRKMYIPQNMIFCVVGDVDVEASLKRIRGAFAGFDRGRQSRTILPEVKSPANIRRAVQVHKALKDAMQQIGFQTIPLLHDDLYALDVLSFVLSQGRASRLVQAVERDKKLVTSISTSSWTPQWGKGYFSISFRSEPDKADTAETAIIEELKKVVEKGVADEELERAKRQKIAELVYGQQTAEDIAAGIATDFLATGDAAFSKNYTKRIQDVTTAQAQAVAKKYFNFERMVITRLVPPAAKAAGTAATQPSTSESESKAVTFTAGDGLKVVLQPNSAVGLVSMAFAVEGGVLAEEPKTNGMGKLMTALSTRGTKNFTAKQIDEFFAQAGGSISGKCGNNALYWQATVLDDSFDKALEILAEILNKPKFEQTELDILRPKLLASIKQTDESWFPQLQKFFRSKFFTGSPYARLSVGSSDVITKATSKDVRSYYIKHIAPSGKKRGVLTIYGNFDTPAAKKQVIKLFSDMPKRSDWSLDAVKAEPRKVAPEGEFHVLKTPNKVAAVTVAVPGMKVTNLEDRFAITVLDAIISGYHLPSGWLHTELRGKQLVYVVHAYNWAGLVPGAFMTYAAGQPENAPEIVKIIKTNYRRAARHVPTRRKIDEVVNSILTAELLGSQSMSELALAAALDELYGFGYDFRGKMEAYYRKVTPGDVVRVAKKYLSGGYVVAVTTPKPELFKKDTESK